jgi:hypothetical protein
MNNASPALLDPQATPAADNPAAPAVLPVPREQVPLREALRHIRDDASDEPNVYLVETIVPLGGE